MAELSHLDGKGQAHMVDVGGKAVTIREAVARGRVLMQRETLEILRRGEARKGDVLGTARLAGIMAAKRTPELVPLCHPIFVTAVSVELWPDQTRCSVEIEARVRTQAQTGVEMEALTAAAVAGLTVYDMLKAVDRAMVLADVRLVEKSGGKSGTFRREGEQDVPGRNNHSQ